MLSDTARDQHQEPDRRRGRWPGPLQAQERRSSARALRRVRRRHRGAGRADAGGQGRALRGPAQQPPRAGHVPGRSGGRPGVARRAGPRAPGRHDHRSGRGREDADVWSRWAACSLPSSWTVSRSSRWPTSPRPEDFVPALAAALDVKEAEDRTLGEGIVSLIGDRKALLLLDNLEQVVSAAPEVARLVERCPSLRIVTTSRTPLRIAAEREYPLAPLALPPSSDGDSIESLMAYSGDRAVRRARPSRRTASFALTPQNAGAVAAVCRRLDGLPLALELAAARLRTPVAGCAARAARPRPGCPHVRPA